MLCLTGEAKVVALSLEAKNTMLYQHSVHTAHLALGITEVMVGGNGERYHGLRKDDIFLAGLLHDAGKLYISNSILLKDSSLTEREMETMRFHPIWGAQYIKKIDSLCHLSQFIRQHHESPNGKGYPNGSPLEDIHPVSRVLGIADRFSAMVIDRPYRKAFTPESTVAILQRDIDAFFNGSSTLIINYLLNASGSLTDCQSECVYNRRCTILVNS